MTRLIVSFIVAFIGIALMCVVAQKHYSDKFDNNLNMAALLNDDKRRNEYYNCVTDLGPCNSDDQKFFKGIVFESIATNCEKCTDIQKEALRLATDWFDKNDPNKWNLMLEKTEKWKNSHR